jgi:hypothetical protein
MSGELVAFYQGATELRPVAFSAATASSLSQALIRPERRISPVRSGADPTVVLANPDLIGKLGVAVPLSIPGWASIVGSVGCCFRFLPEPCEAPGGDPRSPPSTQRSAALRQATETDTGGSVVVGLAMRGLERLAV